MLLTQTISTQQSLYASIEIQIQDLQAQQREIQSYLQTLGGIESKMESAALLVQEAIAEIKQHCPDELGDYKTLVTSFFDSTPVAQIQAGNDTDPTPPVPPTPPASDDVVTVDAVAQPVVDEASTVIPAPTPAPVASDAVAVVADVVVDQPDPVATVTTDNTSNDSQGGAIGVVLPTVSQVPSMKKAELIQHLQALKMSTDGSVKDLKMRLGAYVMQQRKTAA